MPTSDIVLNFRVVSIAETINNRIVILLAQELEGQTLTPGNTGPGTTSIFLDEAEARTIFPGDLYTMTFAPTPAATA